MKICREFYFDAAHFLPDYDGKCAKLHGHTYKLEVVVGGRVKNGGMIMDFSIVKMVVNENVIDKLDHSSLNERFLNPTAEAIAVWIFGELKKGIPGLVSVKLWEGQHSWAEYDGKW